VTVSYRSVSLRELAIHGKARIPSFHFPIMPCRLLAPSSSRNLVVDLAVGELVDLRVVLVAHAGLVGEVVDLWRSGLVRLIMSGL
jgi:hypothetical protein